MAHPQVQEEPTEDMKSLIRRGAPKPWRSRLRLSATPFPEAAGVSAL